MTLRATTNLVINPDLKLSRQEMTEGFMYLYNKGYTGKEPIFITRIWASTLLPSLPASPSFGKDSRGIRRYAQWFGKKVHSGLTEIKKINDVNDPHFVCSVPLLVLTRGNEASGLATVRSSLLSLEDTMADNWKDGGRVGSMNRPEEEQPELKSIRKISGHDVIHNIKGLDAKATTQLGKTIIGMREVTVGALVVVYLDLRISPREASQLTNTEWIAIRNIDLYPLVSLWVSGCFGYTVSAPTSSFPVSKIAKTLPQVQKGQARICKFGVSIGPDGIPRYLPEQLDNTQRYEDLFATAGDREDGVFSLLRLDLLEADDSDDEVDDKEDKKEAKNPMESVPLPRNIPVLIDWVNNKYAYTNTHGALQIQDLARFRAMDSSHAMTLMKNKILSVRQLKGFVNLSGVAGVEPQIHLTKEEEDYLKRTYSLLNSQMTGNEMVDTYLDLLSSAVLYENNKDLPQDEHEFDHTVRLIDIALEGKLEYRPIARFIQALYLGILNNLDAMYARYSVSYVSSNFALIVLIAKYVVRAAEVAIEDETNRQAAINQKVDPNWEMPSVPLVNDKMGVLPHQKKVRNLLKDSPAFAILPIQAGGGKSPMTILDVLYEIKAKRSQPYLILCPPHLVAQYVKEMVFFTKGQINCIAINSIVIRRNGLERLGKMIASAPRNTVVIVDYDILRAKAEQVCYGTTNVTVYPIIEFLRQFSFGYAMLDESHVVKNDSARTRACMALIADIPKKRLASGTMAHDSPSDLAIQIAILDPTLFGTRDEFNTRFGLELSGDRVKVWKPGAQKHIMDIIKSRVVVAGAMRKEWAALLPTPEEVIHGVDLNPNQYQVYQLLFEWTMEKIREAAKTNKKLQEFLDTGGVKRDLEGDEGETDIGTDDDEGEDISALLNPYLARIEQFTTAPARDPLGDKMLKGEDRISPKVAAVIKCIRQHLDQKLPGKVLVFTNYVETAEELYDQLPQDLKSQALLYVASEKVEAGAEFENNPNKTIMIGVEQSMNTGLNFQFVARLIRVESVWNPGTLEQGNSRINRPELKKADRRDKIYYDLIVADRTIDVTKMSRLLSKLIANAKFENAEDPIYEEIPDVPIMKMNLKTVLEYNSWSDTLEAYGVAYRTYKEVQAKDYAAYRAKHGELSLAPVTVAPNPEDAAIIPDVPYTPGLELYNEAQLGLVRLDEYLRSADTDVDDEGDGDEDDDASKSAKAKERMAALAEDLKGQVVHTEFGDAVVKGVQLHAKTIIVSVPPGYEVRTRFSTAFVITKNLPKGKTVKDELVKAIGLPVAEKTKVVPANFKLDKTAARRQAKQQQQEEKERKKKQAEKPAVSVELDITVTNGFLGLTYFNESADEAANALQALGFRPTPEFLYAPMDNAQRLLKQFDMWRDAGFTMGKENPELIPAIRDFHKLLKAGKVKSHITSYNFATRNDLRNFYRMEHKPTVDKKLIKPFPMIEDGRAYLMLPIRGQAGSIPATRVRAPGVRWSKSIPSMVYYGLNPANLSHMIKQVLASGIQIANIDDLRKAFKKIQKLKGREE